MNDEHVTQPQTGASPRSAARDALKIEHPKAVVIGDDAVVNIHNYGDQSGSRNVQTDLSPHRRSASLHATRLVQIKSRLLKPIGDLPQLTPLLVALHTPGIRHRYDETRRMHSDQRTSVIMPFFEAIRLSQCIALLGDMGSGKSTLAGMLVERICEETESGLAFVVPAKGLKQEVPSTISELLGTLSLYFNGQISPTTSPIAIIELLNAGIDVTIVLDGLDEIPPGQRAILANQLAEVTVHWANAKVMITGRPVEIAGLSFDDWQVLRIIPLTPAARVDIFSAEARAEGLSEVDAVKNAFRLERKLSTLPHLRVLADSPFTVRSIYSKLLDSDDRRVVTVGDLIYDLIHERLTNWPVRDSKRPVYHLLERRFPDGHSRFELLGEIAMGMLIDRLSASTASIRFRLIEAWHAQRIDQAEALADEALLFYEQTGLISVGEEIEIVIQPALEMLCGYTTALRWQRLVGTPANLSDSDWRVVSYAATAARKLGLVDSLRSQFATYLESLLSAEPNGPTAAYHIVGELQDRHLAETHIEMLRRQPPRILSSISGETRQSARATAEAISLSGEQGFDWMFDNHLDPRFPIINWGSRTIELVLEQWAWFSLECVSEHQRSRLATMIAPHLQAGTSQLISLIPVLALLIPDDFEPKARFWYTAQFLESDLFGEIAEDRLIAACNSDHKDLVNAVLIGQAKNGVENVSHAAGLWLRINSDAKPPIEIAQALVYAQGSHFRNHERLNEFILDCANKIGQQDWQQMLWGNVMDNNPALAAGAAICLYKSFAENTRGLAGLQSLGKALISALHDGAYNPRAEGIIAEMLGESGNEGTEWLAESICADDHSLGGSYSAHWRLILPALKRLGSKGIHLLEKTIGTISCFVLPRYPEVRKLFCDLLSSEDGEDYARMLRAKLQGEDHKLGDRAAMILLICNPKKELDALERVVRIAPRNDVHNLFEWRRFCQTLSFGAESLAHLKSKLPVLNDDAATFTLSILHRNGERLSPAQQEHLVHGLTNWWNWELDPDDPRVSLIANTGAFESLVKVVETGVSRQASNAADKLVRHHLQKLNDQLQSRCFCLATEENGYHGFQLLRVQMQRLANDVEYATLIKQAADLIVEQGGRRPLLDLLREAMEVEGSWVAVINRLLFEREYLLESIEEGGRWLLDAGKFAPCHRTAIGKDAVKLLDQLNFDFRYRAELFQWLAIIADEFVGLPNTMIEKALLYKRGIIRESATSALIARLGYIPQDFQKQHGLGSVLI